METAIRNMQHHQITTSSPTRGTQRTLRAIAATCRGAHYSRFTLGNGEKVCFIIPAEKRSWEESGQQTNNKAGKMVAVLIQYCPEIQPNLTSPCSATSIPSRVLAFPASTSRVAQASFRWWAATGASDWPVLGKTRPKISSGWPVHLELASKGATPSPAVGSTHKQQDTTNTTVLDDPSALAEEENGGQD